MQSLRENELVVMNGWDFLFLLVFLGSLGRLVFCFHTVQALSS